MAAGDIACPPGHPPTGAPGDPRLARGCQQARTAALAASLAPDAVAVLGDAENDRGTLAEFEGSFAPTWGTFGRLLRPAVGNHEYTVRGAPGYFDYFGPAAGPRGRGYYSYDLGRWHVVVLNSNCGQVSCRRGSRQERWLRSDLATHSARCTLAYWHHPRFSSGYHGNDGAVAAFWGDLQAKGADVVLNGHDHQYERFARQDADGRRDSRRGIRELIVGTGGMSLGPLRHRVPATSQRRANSTFGVLALTLRPTGYSWRFVPEPGGSFRDSGSEACH